MTLRPATRGVHFSAMPNAPKPRLSHGKHTAPPSKRGPSRIRRFACGAMPLRRAFKRPPSLDLSSVPAPATRALDAITKMQQPCFTHPGYQSEATFHARHSLLRRNIQSKQFQLAHFLDCHQAAA
ncbi:hypothetical protein [Chromobacterium sp. IIBBL 290-4]|uniref:hypothetical protein n=1 Tax=Chromobacterium sp. IIBBL 290-4 TaxID=2953890 RepID=UPI0020B7921C|nr:hypothetical protein [Chromobacterium sp. IIBBL 290-4]UTH75082.1 hypothetical protein NKT35_02985 [Chromobacterium sp. IIBBL 290-4]